MYYLGVFLFSTSLIPVKTPSIPEMGWTMVPPRTPIYNSRTIRISGPPSRAPNCFSDSSSRPIDHLLYRRFLRYSSCSLQVRLRL